MNTQPQPHSAQADFLGRILRRALDLAPRVPSLTALDLEGARVGLRTLAIRAGSHRIALACDWRPARSLDSTRNRAAIALARVTRLAQEEIAETYRTASPLSPALTHLQVIMAEAAEAAADPATT